MTAEQRGPLPGRGWLPWAPTESQGRNDRSSGRGPRLRWTLDGKAVRRVSPGQGLGPRLEKELVGPSQEWGPLRGPRPAGPQAPGGQRWRSVGCPPGIFTRGSCSFLTPPLRGVFSRSLWYLRGN